MNIAFLTIYNKYEFDGCFLSYADVKSQSVILLLLEQCFYAEVI
ncbi:hypothetical protein SAMN05444371_2945 [Epilithonimonas mollis]|uniref:Uncharacterized protein n=1 Tax=Epilithonimonas mollis TaxID=216903 RepID=A0A1M6TU65_9FLAO|nr:hypothetical protein SAMN05444371_2945 [Epilithonimonas mollis]